jgi:type I restriction enzyme S subunit|tara:strand:- start:2418 stop:3620 length:1203 start_codon:yes stop_codon:yes gene_type:complete
MDRYAFLPEIVKKEKTSIKRGPFGSALKKSFFVEKGYKVYEQKNAIKDDFSLGHYYINKEKFEELKGFEVKPGDIIISCSGTIGKISVAPDNIEKGIINQALLKISLNNDVIITPYFRFWFENYVLQGELESIGAAIKNIVSVKELKQIPIPLPSLPEQKRIVVKLDSLFQKIDQAIGLLEKNIAHTVALMGSVLDEEFGRLERKGIKPKAIKDFAKTKSGGTPKRSEKQFWNGKIPWLKSGELNDSFNINKNTEFITEIGLQKSSASLFEKGTLLMAMYGATAGRLGILGMDACTNQAVCSIQNDKNLFDEIYLYFFLLSQRERIIRESSGGAQPNISKGYIDKLEIPLPNLETQKCLSKKFFDYQNGINLIVGKQSQKLNHLKALKSSLLDQAFKGEL